MIVKATVTAQSISGVILRFVDAYTPARVDVVPNGLMIVLYSHPQCASIRCRLVLDA